MKSILFKTLVIVLAIGVSGCTSYFKRSVKIAEDNNGEFKGAVFVWEPDSNAAVVSKDGQTCMQNALSISESDIELKASLNKSADVLAEQAKNKDINPEEKQALASISSSIVRSAKELNVSTETTSFLNIGMFYLCQLEANEGLESQEVEALTKQLILSAASIQTTSKQIVDDAPSKDDTPPKIDEKLGSD